MWGKESQASVGWHREAKSGEGGPGHVSLSVNLFVDPGHTISGSLGRLELSIKRVAGTLQSLSERLPVEGASRVFDLREGVQW
jgi:hypothetical protein